MDLTVCSTCATLGPPVKGIEPITDFVPTRVTTEDGLILCRVRGRVEREKEVFEQLLSNELKDFKAYPKGPLVVMSLRDDSSASDVATADPNTKEKVSKLNMIMDETLLPQLRDSLIELYNTWATAIQVLDRMKEDVISKDSEAFIPNEEGRWDQFTRKQLEHLQLRVRSTESQDSRATKRAELLGDVWDIAHKSLKAFREHHLTVLDLQCSNGCGWEFSTQVAFPVKRRLYGTALSSRERSEARDVINDETVASKRSATPTPPLELPTTNADEAEMLQRTQQYLRSHVRFVKGGRTVDLFPEDLDPNFVRDRLTEAVRVVTELDSIASGPENTQESSDVPEAPSSVKDDEHGDE